MDNGFIKIKDENGEIIEYEILACININNKEFLVYTFPSQQNVKEKVFVNSISFDNGAMLLDKVSKDEYQKVLNRLNERVAK